MYNCNSLFQIKMRYLKSACCVLLCMSMLVSISGSYIERLQLEPLAHRPGYDYAKTLNAFYKIHDLPQTWNMARAMCQAEGAALMWFHNENEVQEMLQKIPKSDNKTFLGIHSKFSKNNFVTVTGLQIEDVYNKWARDQPYNEGDNVDCVGISGEGVTSVLDCNIKLPFMCRREYDGNINYLNNNCKTYDKGYVYEITTERCYKVHTEPKNWTDAYTICSAEGAYLAVVNSLEESQALVKLTNNVHIYGEYWLDKTQFLVGFHDMFAEGEYRTIFGETLKEAGFDNFASGQPNNVEEQDCGGMSSQGTLNDLWCTQPFPFICERELSIDVEK